MNSRIAASVSTLRDHLLLIQSLLSRQEAEEEDAESPSSEPEPVCGAAQPHARQRPQPSRARPRGDPHG